MPSLRSGKCTPGFHKVSQTSGSPVENNWDKINHLTRRHPDNVKNQGISSNNTTITVNPLSRLGLVRN